MGKIWFVIIWWISNYFLDLVILLKMKFCFWLLFIWRVKFVLFLLLDFGNWWTWFVSMFLIFFVGKRIMSWKSIGRCIIKRNVWNVVVRLYVKILVKVDVVVFFVRKISDCFRSDFYSFFCCCCIFI